jgi:hypothetical protein
MRGAKRKKITPRDSSPSGEFRVGYLAEGFGKHAFLFPAFTSAREMQKQTRPKRTEGA